MDSDHGFNWLLKGGADPQCSNRVAMCWLSDIGPFLDLVILLLESGISYFITAILITLS